jgi:hypothetical protein
MKPLHRWLAASLLVWALPAPGAEPAWDVTGPAKEPKYQSEPRYALVVFGPKAQTRVWMVLDGPVLYVDLNANGDLTEPGERLQRKDPKDGSNRFGNPGLYTHFDVFDFEVTAWRGQGSARLSLNHWIRDEKFEPETDFDKMIHKDWLANRFETATLWRKAGETSAQNPVSFARKPADAQVCHLDGPLTFGLKGVGDDRLKRGAAGTDLALHIGTPGRPPVGKPAPFNRPAFAPLVCTEVPADAYLVAEIEFPGKNPGGEPVRVRVPLKQRC